jgi:hypothetical protein
MKNGAYKGTGLLLFDTYRHAKAFQRLHPSQLSLSEGQLITGKNFENLAGKIFKVTIFPAQCPLQRKRQNPLISLDIFPVNCPNSQTHLS